MTSSFKRALAAVPRLLKLDRQVDEIKINQGRILATMQRELRLPSLSDYEFKVFSQWGEDGILQHLTTHLAIEHRTFIEFGVEDFHESNCRFLLMKDRWAGFVIDGSEDNMARLRSSYFYWQYPLQSKASFITRENVDALLSGSGFDRRLGILSVDIDGVDWFVLEALADWRPAILIVEYNGVFGRTVPVSVPYVADFQRSARHSSNLYYGANLPAFAHLLEPRGYSLVGVNGAGSNAFFVRNELLNDRVPAVGLDQCYRDSTFREGRDDHGQLSFLAGADRRRPIAHLPLVNVATGAALRVGDLVG
jgi:hypothetical protein